MNPKHVLRRMLARVWAEALAWRAGAHPLTAGRVLVVSPHADDETLGCGGLIAERAERGFPTNVVYLTDSGGTSPEPTTRRELARQRRAEALDALRILGVPAGEASFLGAPDGRLNRLDTGEAEKLRQGLAEVVERGKPDAVYLPFLGSHSTEHEAAHRICREVLDGCGWRGNLWEYPVWAWWNPPRFARRCAGKPAPTALTLGPRLETKRRALRAHASQHLAGAGLPQVLGEICLAKREFFFPVKTPRSLPDGKRGPQTPGIA